MLRVTKILALLFALVTLGLFTSCGSDRSNVRYVHVAASSGSADVALDVAVDGKIVASNLAYEGVSPASAYLAVSAGSRKVQMSTTGTTDDLINSTISFASGRHYTLLATGFVTLPSNANANFNMAAVLLTDDNSAPPSGNAKVRIMHAAPFDGVDPNGTNLDVYIVAPGTDISGVAPTIANLPYGQASSYQSVPATNQVIVTDAGSKSAIFTYDTLAAGQIRTLIVVNAQDTTMVSATPVVLADLN